MLTSRICIERCSFCLTCHLPHVGFSYAAAALAVLCHRARIVAIEPPHVDASRRKWVSQKTGGQYTDDIHYLCVSMYVYIYIYIYMYMFVYLVIYYAYLFKP